MPQSSTLVIGAGIVGASIAYHLAARGGDVTLVDAGLPGSGATRHSFGWIGRAPADRSAAAALRGLGRQHWARLAEEVPDLEVHWSGALVWGDHFGGGTTRSGQAAAREPRLTRPPELSEFRPDDGWLHPVDAAEALVSAAQGFGATVRCGSPVTRLLTSPSGTVTGIELGSETLTASTVVVAAGVGSSALCASAGLHLPLLPSPAILVRLRAPGGIVHGIVANDLWEARQDIDGTVLLPLDYTDESSRRALVRVAEDARDVFAQSFVGGSAALLESVEIGWRPMLANGGAAVGHTGIPGLYVAVAHPGVTLASIIGDAASDEILTGEPRVELTPHRPPLSS